MAGKDGVEADDTVLVRDLDAAQKRRVLLAGTEDLGTRIVARGIGCPDVDIQHGHGLARVDVDKLQLEVHGQADLVLGDVLPDQLALDVEGTHGLGTPQDARRVGAEDVVQGARLERHGACHVVIDRVVVDDLVSVAALEVAMGGGEASFLAQPVQGACSPLDGQGTLCRSCSRVRASSHPGRPIRRCAPMELGLSLQVRDVSMVIAGVGKSS
jgi:hypothetical protein